MALAGFNKSNIDIEVISGELTIKSKNKTETKQNDGSLIHQGISKRSFVRKFTISEEILVKEATMNDGMLIIHLEKFIPEHKKPKNNIYKIKKIRGYYIPFLSKKLNNFRF